VIFGKDSRAERLHREAEERGDRYIVISAGRPKGGSMTRDQDAFVAEDLNDLARLGWSVVAGLAYALVLERAAR
jgi:hypothetical protein